MIEDANGARMRCRTCGGSSFIDAVDNHGAPYRGCATCRVAPAVGTALAEDLRTRAIAAERMHEDAQAHLGDVLEVLRSIAHAVGAGPGLGGQSVDGQEHQTWQDTLARVRALVTEVQRLRAELANCRVQVAAAKKGG